MGLSGRPASGLAYASALSVATCVLTLSGQAKAQLHWDGAAQVGATKRVLSDRPSGGKDAMIGPAVDLQGHVALLPLVRLGAYFDYEISPLGGDGAARDIASGGLHVKVMSPWPRGAVHAWLFFGLGYAGVYQRSTSAVRTFPGPAGGPSVQSPALVNGVHGGYFDVPFGIGASYKLRKPWELCGQLGMHTGFGFRGRAYDEPGPLVTSPGRDESHALPAGKDSFAIGLMVGVLMEL
jgi:hypothetical protein